MAPSPAHNAPPFGTGYRPNGLAVPDALLENLAGLVAERVVGQLPDRPEPWLDVAAAAEYLACPKSRVYELVERKRLQPHRDGRRLLFRTADLDAALTPPESCS